MKKYILAKSPKIVIASIYIYENIKFLIDEYGILYHYTDRVPLGKIQHGMAIWFFETQEQYDHARKTYKGIVKRILE
jgi:hypothetical protein